jgi:hypothetical protein
MRQKYEINVIYGVISKKKCIFVAFERAVPHGVAIG